MDGDPSSLQAAAELFLEIGAASGIQHYPPAASAPAVPAAAPAQAGAASAPPAPGAAEALGELAATIAGCERCGLCHSRTQTVPGEGSSQPRIVFVGEAPGADEDASGRPFVGAAGQLLTKIIEGGLGLPREQVFIANVLKCRPPGNRDPEPEEKAACSPYLYEQLRILQPEVVVALGRHAANHLLDRDASLRSLRGQLHTSDRLPEGTLLLATYHPAYLLRTPSAKADCWADLQIAMEHLGIPVPSKR